MFDGQLTRLGITLPGPFPPHEPLDPVLGFVACIGDAGRHTRSAVGVSALPRGGSVEIEVAVALRAA